MNQRHRKRPVQRLFRGLGGSPLAKVDPKLEKKLGRPATGKALCAKERKAKSRLLKRLKPAGHAAITKLLKEQYKNQPTMMAEQRNKMMDALISHPNAEKIIDAINEHPDNLGLLLPDADQGKGLLISIDGQIIDGIQIFSQSELLFESLIPEGGENKYGPGGKPPKSIRTKWTPPQKYEADNKAFIKSQKDDEIKRLVLVALDPKFTPVEIELEPAIFDDNGEIIQEAKVGPAHKCVICQGINTDKWAHLQTAHNWLVRKESAKARKHYRDASNKSKIEVSPATSNTYEPFQNTAPIIVGNTSLTDGQL